MIRLFKDGKLFYKDRFQDLDFLIDDEGRIVITSYKKLQIMIQPHNKLYKIVNFEHLFSATNMKKKN